MDLKLKTKLRLFLFFSLIFSYSILAYVTLKEVEYDDNYVDKRNYKYFAQNSALVIAGLQREMTIFIMNTINDEGFYIYDARDKQMKEFLESGFDESLEYELETNYEEIESNINGILFGISYFQEVNIPAAKIETFNNLKNIVDNYLSKKENNYFSTLSVKEIISYYKQLSSEIISINEEIKMLPEDNQTKLFVNDYIKLMNLNYNAGLIYGSGAYLAYYKKYDKEIYDDFINAIKNYDKYLDDIINIYNTYANDNIASWHISELKEESFIKYFKEYIIEQYKDGNPPKEDEYFSLLHEYNQFRHKYFNSLYDICDNIYFLISYSENERTDKKEPYLTALILSYLYITVFYTLILYFIFIVTVNIMFYINIRQLKNIKEYLIETYYLNTDLTLDIHVVLGDNIGKIGKNIIEINKFIKNIIC